MLQTKVYKPCPEKCGKCQPCKEFQKVVKEIDLTRISKHERETRAKKP